MFRLFVRTWWKWNNKHELIPCMGNKKYHGLVSTEEDARLSCKVYNDMHRINNPLKKKMEYERI